MSRIDWPSLLAGLMMLFYWGRVIKLVFKTKKLTGRAANFVPPELLGRILRIVWYPNVVAWVVIPIIVAFTWHKHVPGLTLLWHNAVAQWAALIVAGVAYYFTLVCWRKMGRDWRMGIDPNEKNTLIISGPYALVRHPIYALQCSLAVLTFLASPTVVLGIVALLQCVLLQWEARREEKHMLSVHGDVYGDYMRQVGRFLPRGRYRGGDGVKAALNVFQKTQRLWDTIHPYNAAQAMELAGDFPPARVAAAFHDALEDLGLGEFVLGNGRYFVQPPMHPPTVLTDAASVEDLFSAEMNRPFDRDISMPFRPFDIWDGGRHFVGLTYQHWVADSVSIRMLMRRWLDRLTGVAEPCRPVTLPEGGLVKSFGPAVAGWSVIAQAASLFSLQSRLKKMRRVEGHGRWDVRVLLRGGPDGLVAAVRSRAKTLDATVGDVFLAAAAVAVAEHGPAVRTKRHPGLCMGTIVDLRARRPRPADRTFGLYLGFLMTDLPDPATLGFAGVLKKAVAARKTATRRKSAEASQLNMTLGYALARRMKQRKLLEFYRKRFPVAAGLSSVNMTPGWAGAAHPSPLVAYHRVSPTGPLLPIVLTPTTLGDRLDVCFTYRTALLNGERAEALVNAFTDRLKTFAG